MQITSSNTVAARLPSSMAPVIAKLSIDTMLVQQLSMMTTGSLMISDPVKVSIAPPAKVDPLAATAMTNADGTPAAGTTAAAAQGTNAHVAPAQQGGFVLYL